jgi:hypothetical protein
MRILILLIGCLFQQVAYGQQDIRVSFKNDYKDVYHLALVVYTPDGKNQTRVSNLDPGQVKAYAFPVGTEIFIADRKQEAFAMKGNDIKATGVQPAITIKEGKNDVVVVLSTLSQPKDATKK